MYLNKIYSLFIGNTITKKSYVYPVVYNTSEAALAASKRIPQASGRHNIIHIMVSTDYQLTEKILVEIEVTEGGYTAYSPLFDVTGFSILSEEMATRRLLTKLKKKITDTNIIYKHYID